MKNELDLGTSLNQVTKWLDEPKPKTSTSQCCICGKWFASYNFRGEDLCFDHRMDYKLKVDNRVTLRCNECGKKRKVASEGNYNERCPKCGGVDWDVVE